MSGACGPEPPEEQSACCTAEDTTWPTRDAQQYAVPTLEQQPPDGTRTKKTMAEVEQELEDLAYRTLDDSDDPVTEVEAADILQCLVTLSDVEEEVIQDAWRQILETVRGNHAEAMGGTEATAGAGSSTDHMEDAVLANLTALDPNVLAYLRSHSNPALAALIATAMQATVEDGTTAAASAVPVSEDTMAAAAQGEEQSEESDEEEEELSPEEVAAKAARDAEVKAVEARESIRLAAQACGEECPELLDAMRLIQEVTSPLAQGAAMAQQIIHDVLMRCPPAAEKAVKKADRDVRDVVVLRCRARVTNLKDREGFLEKAAEAYGGQLDKEIRAQLLLAYHKDPSNKKRGFVSNNQVAAERRGGPRPRRRRQSRDKQDDDGRAPSPGPERASSRSQGAAGPRQPSVGRASSVPKKKVTKKSVPVDVPMYIEVPKQPAPVAMTPAHMTQCRLEAASRRRYLVLAELKDILVFRDDSAVPEPGIGEYQDIPSEGYRVYFRPWAEELVGELLQESMVEFAILSQFSIRTSLVILQSLLKNAGLGDWKINLGLHMVTCENYPRIVVFQRSGWQVSTACPWSWPPATTETTCWYQEQESLRADFQKVLELMNTMPRVAPLPDLPTPTTSPFVMNRLCFIATEFERQQFPRHVIAVNTWPESNGACAAAAIDDNGLKEVLDLVRAIIESSGTVRDCLTAQWKNWTTY